MDKGEPSTFLIITYSGSVGIYFSTEADMASGAAPRNCKFLLHGGSVLGEKGLLKAAPRSATVTAETDMKALYLSAKNYANVIANVHKGLMYNNINFMKLLPLFDKFSYERHELIAKTFMTKICDKGQIVVKIGDAASMLYIVKRGTLDVVK
jgi:CRP-like cAMP-binding protein